MYFPIYMFSTESDIEYIEEISLTDDELSAIYWADGFIDDYNIESKDICIEGVKGEIVYAEDKELYRFSTEDLIEKIEYNMKVEANKLLLVEDVGANELSQCAKGILGIHSEAYAIDTFVLMRYQFVDMLRQLKNQRNIESVYLYKIAGYHF